ncbi:SEC-C metal-binding domain-containing protein [Pseudocolwellia agarivorans]|uniref:SEC-C metal-binding domain-containing protein n=1 Tax=Pseudocolwellia agarivorans TaxID=1911682 RepID=UPI000986B57B|nr:SEC-C metal-binding domain-containing protein [Pseudocolwellia agarivorans]
MVVLIFANQRLNEQSDENILEALFTNNELSELEDFNYPTTKPFIAELKVGRNDPCTCGSGKKT